MLDWVPSIRGLALLSIREVDRCTGACTVGVRTCMGGAAFMFTEQEGGCSCVCFCIHL